MQSRTFLPLTSWVPLEGLRAAFEVRAAPQGAATVVTARYSEDGSTGTGWTDVGTEERQWTRFGVVFRGVGDEAR